MKNYILLALYAILGICQVKGQIHDIHVYLNNGDIHSFFYNRADSITFNSANEQIVWTTDSLYSVNISAIDSISFGGRTLPISFYEENFAGWSDVLFCNSGMVAFHADKTEDNPEKSLILLPDDVYGLICCYVKYDEHSYPYLISFNDDVIYVSEDTANNPLYTIIQGDSLIYQIGSTLFTDDYISSRKVPRRSWSENNWQRNTIAVGKVITGFVESVGSGFVIIGSLGLGGPSNPVSAQGLVVGGMGFKGGKDLVQSGLETIFVPAAKSSKGMDNYARHTIGNIGKKAIEEGIKSGKAQEFLLKHLPNDAMYYLADAPKESKWTSWTFWGELTFEALDAKFGETITKADKLKAIYDKGNVITGIVKDITPYSATVRGYVSPELTYGLNGENIDVEYGIIVKGNGANFTKKLNNEHGGLIEFNLDGLSPSCEYTYFAYVWDRTDAILRYGDEKSFITPVLPIAVTGECSNITITSSIVSCAFENVPDDGVCGIEYTWNNGFISESLGRINGSQNVSLSNLIPGTTYTYCAFVEAYGQTYYGGNGTFTTESINSSVNLSDFKVTKAQYKENGFENDGIKYDYCFDVSVTATLNTEDVSYITDWGYVYEDLNGDTAHISLKTMGSPYTDIRYSYYRNEPESYARLYGYVKYYGDESFYHGEKTDYPLIYDKQPKAITLEPTCIDETWATIKCAYKESAPWNGICGVEYWKDNDHKEILFELAQDEELEISLSGLVPSTIYYYRAFIKIDDRYIYAEDTQTIKTSQAIISICPDDHHPHLIDLGLPSGTKWQCCNVDAPSPLEAGGYYAWGETYEKAVYNRYTHSGDVVISDSHDIAYVVSNGQTRMPTRTQIQEILNSCSWTWESHNGVLGAMVTAPNGNAIFLPAASFKDSNRSENLGAPYGTYGSYWGRDLGGVVNYGRTPTLVGTELIFGILDGNIGFVPSNYYYTWGNTGWVYCGRSIRPVSAETEQEYEFTLSTQEPVKVEAETAIVNCYFKGFKEKNGVCGVQYWDDDNTYEVTIDATEDGVQEILLEDLTANTQYRYRAFVQIGNINIYADEILMFKTNSSPYSGSNQSKK